jgi:hypothetical protein
MKWKLSLLSVALVGFGVLALLVLQMTWEMCLEFRSLLAACPPPATVPDATKSDKACRPAPAPYYNQIADIIYPERPACSEPVQWVRLFEAMARQRRGDRACAPTQERLTHDDRDSYVRELEQQRVSLRKMRVLYWILADCPDQPDAAAAELGQHRKVADPRGLSRPCALPRVPRDAEETPVPSIPRSRIPYLPMVHHNVQDIVEQVRVAVVPGTAVVRQAVAITNNDPWRLSAPGIEATADRVTWIRDTDQVLLEGNVVLKLTQENQPATIITERALVNIEDGTYEVMPPNLEENNGRPTKPKLAPAEREEIFKFYLDRRF